MKNSIKYRAQKYFQVLSFLFLGASLAYFLMPFIPFTQDLGRHLPFVNNSVIKTILAWFISIYIAGDVIKRRGLILVFILGHIFSIISMLLYILLTDTSYIMQFSPWSMDVLEYLLFSIFVDIVVTVPAIIFYLNLKNEVDSNNADEFKKENGFLKYLCLILSITFFLAAIGYHIGAYLPTTRDFFIQLPLVSNSAVKVAFMGMLCYYVYINIERNVSILNIVIVSHIISILCQALYAMSGRATAILDLTWMQMSEASILWGAVVLDSVITLIVLKAYLKYWNLKFGQPKFLHPGEFRALMALSEVILEGHETKKVITTQEIASGVDTYLNRMTAKKKWIYRVVLYLMQSIPVFYGKAPLSELDYSNKKDYLISQFYSRGKFIRNARNLLNNYIRAAIRLSQQICFVGYYNNPKVHPEIGYEFFSKRPRYNSLPIPEPKKHPLDVLLPKDITETSIEADICIVGSGAAGSILAFEMAKKGRNVLLLEKGKYTEPKDFNEDEVDMIGKLYGDGVFLQTEDFKFTILQANCIGGTTVVNNAVCFDMPDEILDHWNSTQGPDSGIDKTALELSFKHIRSFISVGTQDQTILNPGDDIIDQGLKTFDPNGDLIESGIVDANISGCFGCGYCNMGCKYGKKLSMLDTVLPWTQRDFPGKLKIIAECQTLKISYQSGSTKSADTLLAKLSDGRKIDIKAKTFILSAGAIASSYILKKSGLGKNLPVGKNLCFNVGSPVYGVFDKKIRAHDGLQIAHYYKPKKLDKIIFESWWNPPVSQAINMPGWFSNHFKNMLRYDQTLALGVLKASKSTGYIVNALTGGPGVKYAPDLEERKELAKGLKLAGEILFASGAKEVMYNTWNEVRYSSPEELNNLFKIVEETDELALGTGHPQGGNAISRDPSKGVVNENFQVHGFSNLYVCDASIFPTSVSVNPQLTVMALAYLAASKIQ